MYVGEFVLDNLLEPPGTLNITAVRFAREIEHGFNHSQLSRGAGSWSYAGPDSMWLRCAQKCLSHHVRVV
jgi:hypothetical protein